jgi:hypothetical protein
MSRPRRGGFTRDAGEELLDHVIKATHAHTHGGVLGSSGQGPRSRVSIGSRAAKIITSTSVPVLVVPREAG